MKYMQILGGIIGLLTNIPLFIGIYRGEVKQNFATWILWAFLDVIAASSIILQHGNFYLPLAYCCGSTTMTLLLLYKKEYAWTWLETTITTLVTICLVVWYCIGDRAATIASTTAICIASLPLIVDTAKQPSTAPTKIYILFCLANGLSFFGGTTWTVEQKLYPGAILVFCILVTLLSMRKGVHKTSTG